MQEDEARVGQVLEVCGTTTASVGGRMDVGPHRRIWFRLAEDRQRVEVRVDRLSDVALFVIMKMMDLLTTLSYVVSRKS